MLSPNYELFWWTISWEGVVELIPDSKSSSCKFYDNAPAHAETAGCPPGGILTMFNSRGFPLWLMITHTFSSIFSDTLSTTEEQQQYLRVARPGFHGTAVTGMTVMQAHALLRHSAQCFRHRGTLHTATTQNRTDSPQMG